jgi:hypothetical protein
MVVIGAWVVQDRPLSRADPPDDAQLLEERERRVHSRRREAWEPVGDGAEHLFRGHVSIELAQRAMDHEPLSRDALATLSQRGGQSAVGVGCRGHGSGSAWRYLRVGLTQSLVQVTLGGALVALVGVAVGHA